MVGGAPDDLDRLRARGLLGDDPDTVAFFHQTFFEYAASLDLLQRGEDGDLATRVAERPDDAFLAAIHEQLLVLLSSGPAADRAARGAIELLSDPHTARRVSGLYAYVAWRVSNPELESRRRRAVAPA